ncbi:MAG: hypothetical protein AAF074_22035, partial [Pseudomonadota bacterium]
MLKETPESAMHPEDRHGAEMTGAEMVVQALKDQGVEVVFGYPGVSFSIGLAPGSAVSAVVAVSLVRRHKKSPLRGW